ncbi:MAG: hypothetical protein ACPGSC_10700 [Granulosicoccaceae bacterium]
MSNFKKIDHLYKAERRRAWLQGGAILASFFLVIVLITFPFGDKTEVIATATDANISYRTKGMHKQQVQLDDGQLLMVDLPQQITLIPGQKIVLSEHYLVTLGLKRYHFVSLLRAAEPL